ncbi:ribose/xylose/arabinose/galactoside ABC-type transport system permease subunit [Kaistia hirudinis]|uniref:Ribose/xylose/arabinose/galactoside ABC-type transport system permease subunit n=1 Tax=Kaistia hirudinis TaxID=1293440 RepID=A0A840ANZ8_9HYPH|nr:ABC transporter permease [Kaistia hirudinis]MBB3930136.1 ribose/xylose/arabinose/galactoside ABC-type transport system permease subunit [Kaistia hirudinis]
MNRNPAIHWIISDRQRLQTVVTLLVLLLMIAAFSFLNPRFLTLTNFQNVARNTAPLIISASAMTVVMIARGLDLSVGSVLAASSVVAATLAVQGVPLPLAFLAAILLGCLIGFANGAIIVKMRVSPIIVTLGALNIARGLAYLITPSAILVGLPRNWGSIGTSSIGPFPMPILLAVLVVAIYAFVTRRTKFGKHIYAVGGNEEAARLSGVNVERTLITLYVLSGAMAALAGLVLSTRVGSGDPNIGVGFELEVIAAVIIGGTSLSGGEGRILGTVIGAVIVGVLSNGLNLSGVEPFWQYVAQGVVLIAAVVVDKRVNEGVLRMGARA